MKLILILIIIVLIVVVGYNWFGYSSSEDSIEKVCFRDSCFDVEIADSDEERTRGLMYRDSLCSDCGMLFVYGEEGNYKFWMKNTLIPLDIIWLDEDLEVVYISNAVPCKVEECELYGPSSDVKSKYVLEINSGIAEEVGLVIGNRMIFS